jgi:hypothetical protein
MVEIAVPSFIFVVYPSSNATVSIAPYGMAKMFIFASIDYMKYKK